MRLRCSSFGEEDEVVWRNTLRVEENTDATPGGENSDAGIVFLAGRTLLEDEELNSLVILLLVAGVRMLLLLLSSTERGLEADG